MPSNIAKPRRPDPLETAPDLAALASHLEDQGHEIVPHNDHIFGIGFTITLPGNTLLWIKRVRNTWYIQPISDLKDTIFQPPTILDPAHPNSIEQVEQIIQQCQTISSKP